MTLHRWLIGLLFALWPITLPAQQASWPTNPIRVIVPYPPGSSGDIILRRLAPLGAQKLGGTVYVDNRPGANRHLAVEAVKNATPDGLHCCSQRHPVLDFARALPEAAVRRRA